MHPNTKCIMATGYASVDTSVIAIPATYQNGQWRLIPMLDSPLLPAGQPDGFYRDATGVHVLTRSYAQLLMPQGITVNMISPGFLENSVGRPPQRLPAGHPGSFNDILGALDYLLSEQASYVSGTNLLVTGAWNLG